MTELGRLERRAQAIEKRKKALLGELSQDEAEAGVEISPEYEYPEGTQIIDCGDQGEIIDTPDDDQAVYEVEFEDGETVPYPPSEIELGIIDGTIRVKA